MTLEPESVHPKSQTDQWLDRLECQWLRNEIPDIAFYLRSTFSPDSALWYSLIELDLEYRWKRFRPDGLKTGRDPYGFPQFPRLEDYAELLDDPHRHLILTPELLAEEYRVRRSWGDRPDKREYLERLPLDSESVASALDQIDTEFEIERATPIQTEESSRKSDESTWLVNQQNKRDAKLTVEPDAPRTIGKYRLEKMIGRGGFGEVWKAHDPDLKRTIAIKIPRRDTRFSVEDLEHFRSEAQKMATLERVPGIVPVYEAGQIDEHVYIVSYLVPGEDLGKLSKRGELPYEKSARIVAQVAETLHRAHLKNLFHRDVKLSNILISEEGDIFLSDFGLCVSEEEQLKEGHSATGTYAYMAPEQIRGQSHRLDGRADIYALGVVLYRLLTARLPFIGDAQSEYLEQVLHREPRPPRSIKDDIPAELERICLKCLSKDVKDRYTTAADLARELRETQTRVGVTSSNGKRVPSIGILSVAAGLSLIVLIGAGLVFGPQMLPKPAGPNEGDETPSPVSDPDVAKPVAPNLLARRPEKVVFHDLELRNQTSWDPDKQVVHVNSHLETLLSFGTVDLRNSVLNARIESLPQPSTRFGFFWGVQETRTLDEKRVSKAHAIWIMHREKFIDDQLRLTTLEIVDSDPDEVRSSVIKEFPFEQRNETSWHIQLHFGEKRLNAITINDHEFSVAPGLFPDEIDLSSCQVGTYSQQANFVVQKLFLEDPDSL